MEIIILFFILILSYFGFQYCHHMKGRPKPEYKQLMHKPDVRDWNNFEVTFTWIGHATVYINVFGVKIITDPVLSKRIGMQLGSKIIIGPKRFTPSALTIDEISDVDVILLSHAHFDHFDIPTLSLLLRPSVKLITAKNTSKLLKNISFANIYELDIGESIDLKNGLTISTVPVKHWGKRLPWNNDYGYTSYLIEKDGVRLWFAGDTAYSPVFNCLKDKGEIDVAFLPIAAYSPVDYQEGHCTPEQAWKIFLESGARLFAPIHWDTFVLSKEPVHEPIERLLKAAGTQAGRIIIREHGEVAKFFINKNMRR